MRVGSKDKKIIFTLSIILISLVIIFVSILITQSAYSSRPVDENRRGIVGLYAEPENSLDAVYIGSSSVYKGWSPLQAYEDHGVASYSYAASGLPASAIKNMIIEAGKTQEPELFIIDISPLIQMNTEKEADIENVASIANSFKNSLNRYDMINRYKIYMKQDISAGDMLKLHTNSYSTPSNKKRLTEESNTYKNNDILSKYKGFRISKYENESLTPDENATKIDKSAEIEKYTYELLDDLFMCIDRKDLNVLFTYPPKYINEDTKAIYNSIEKYISENDYDFYDSMDHYQKMNIDYSSDFQNKDIMNYIGASKYTDYFCNYIKEEYNISDKKNDDKYASWDENYKEYMSEVKELVYSQGLISGELLYAIRDVNDNRKAMSGIYAEPENSLDMIYIGASSVFMGWSPIKAWEEHGIASYSYSNQGLPASTIKNMIIEARKTQNPKLFIIDVSPFMQMDNEKGYSKNHLNRMAIGMNYSANRTNMISSIKKYTLPDMSADELKNSEFDVYLNYDNREDLTEEELSYKNNDVENIFKGFRFRDHPGKAMVITENVKNMEDIKEIHPDTREILNSLFEYIEKNKLEVLFSYPPRYIIEDTKIVYNTIEKYITDKGYEFYDSMDNYEKMGISFTSDLFDKNHMTFSGAQKYSDYFGNYIKKKYDLPDRSDYPWNDNLEEYNKVIDRLNL